MDNATRLADELAPDLGVAEALRLRTFLARATDGDLRRAFIAVLLEDGREHVRVVLPEDERVFFGKTRRVRQLASLAWLRDRVREQRIRFHRAAESRRARRTFTVS